MELTAKIGNKLDNLQTLMDLWMGLGTDLWEKVI